MQPLVVGCIARTSPRNPGDVGPSAADDVLLTVFPSSGIAAGSRAVVVPALDEAACFDK